MNTNGNSNHRILVIDDNPAIHEDFKKILGRKEDTAGNLSEMESELFGDEASHLSPREFQMDSAFQGREGLDLIEKSLQEGRPYAMAFVDVRMPPGWDGVETTAQIWHKYPDLQVVICTAYSDYSWEEMLKKLGRSDRLVILKKPFDNIEVSQLAEALTHKWRLTQEARQKLSDLEKMVQERTEELTEANERLQDEIARHKQAEKERQMMEVQLRQAQKMEAIGQLAAGIAHEINTPTQYVGDNTRFLKDAFAGMFGIVRSHGELLAAARQNSLTPEILEHTEKILAAGDVEYLSTQVPQAIQETLEGVERVTKIVRAMKEFSHPGGSEKTASDLNKALESTVTVAQNEWRYVADVKLELAPDLPLVSCLIGEFNQVILNLIINAAHAIGDVVKQQPGTKGQIIVRTRQVGDSVEVRVSDTGTGIAENHRAHIFEPFFTTKDVGRGTGQGLSIVYGTIVRKHGGTVSFETEVGKGTTFILRLPINATAPEVENSSPTISAK
jgi:two-component system, NtrC family, sensor kinase